MTNNSNTQTINAFAECTGLKASDVRALIRTGILPAQRPGKSYVLPPAAMTLLQEAWGRAQAVAKRLQTEDETTQTEGPQVETPQGLGDWIEQMQGTH